MNDYPVSEEELQYIEFIVWLFIIVFLIVLVENFYV